MSRLLSRTMPAWVLGGLSVLMLSGRCQADEPGFASTRSVNQQEITPANYQSCPNCPQTVDYGYGGGYCPNSGYGYCPDGYCQGGCYQPCMCNYWGHWWYTGTHQCSQKMLNIISWLHPHGIGTVSPDHGWSPPGKEPMRTVYVPYRNLYPACWNGQPGGSGMAAPSVYMPTDTTQLGYYYQHAPAWRPAPAPGAPIPAQWHRPLCGPGGCGNCQNGGIIYGEISPGQMFNGGEPTPVESETTPPPSPLPAEETGDVLGPTATFLSPRIAN